MEENFPGGLEQNTISPECILRVEIRYERDSERDRLLKALRDITNRSYVDGTKSNLNGLIQRDVMEENVKQLELIKKLERITNMTIPTEKRGGVSDANIVASCGVTTLVRTGLGLLGDCGPITIYGGEARLRRRF